LSPPVDQHHLFGRRDQQRAITLLHVHEVHSQHLGAAQRRDDVARSQRLLRHDEPRAHLGFEAAVRQLAKDAASHLDVRRGRGVVQDLHFVTKDQVTQGFLELLRFGSGEDLGEVDGDLVRTGHGGTLLEPIAG
jgi:hypothetical protein